MPGEYLFAGGIFALRWIGKDGSEVEQGTRYFGTTSQECGEILLKRMAQSRWVSMHEDDNSWDDIAASGSLVTQEMTSRIGMGTLCIAAMSAVNVKTQTFIYKCEHVTLCPGTTQEELACWAVELFKETSPESEGWRHHQYTIRLIPDDLLMQFGLMAQAS